MPTLRVSSLLVVFICCLLIPFSALAGKGKKPFFKEVGGKAGLRNQMHINDGCYTADVNGDGYPDLYISRHQALLPLLATNNGDGTFTVDQLFTFTNDRHGVAWGDFDNDGDEDVYISVGAPDRVNVLKKELWRNDGNGVFVNIADAAGVAAVGLRGRTAAWLDYDNDGDLDLLLVVDGTQENHSIVLFRNNGDYTFTDVSAETGMTNAIIYSNGGVGLADYDGDGDLDILLTSSFTSEKKPNDLFTEFSLLLKHSSDGTFKDVAKQAGIGELTLGRGIAWGDYDNDGDLDLYVSRGVRDETVFQDGVFIRSPNQIEWLSSVKFDEFEDGLDFVPNGGTSVTFDFWKNQDNPLPSLDKVFIGASGAHPTSIPFTLLKTGGSINPTGKPSFTPGTDEGVYIWQDNAGTWHLRVLQITPFRGTGAVGKDTSGFITTDGQFTNVTPVGMEKSKFDMCNKLFRNNGNGTFTDVSDKAGVGDCHDGTSTSWMDFDNDGYLDLVVINAGYDVTNDTITNKPIILYKNNGNGTFTDVTDRAGFVPELFYVRTTAVLFDYNNDGFMDMFVCDDDGPPPYHGKPLVLYKNNGNGNHWLTLKLVGTESNRDAIGAKVTLQTGKKIQFREQNGGFNLIGQNDTRLHFGLGASTKVDRITVEWPSGQVQDFNNIGVDKILVITEGQGITP